MNKVSAPRAVDLRVILDGTRVRVVYKEVFQGILCLMVLDCRVFSRILTKTNLEEFLMNDLTEDGFDGSGLLEYTMSHILFQSS